jgi:hypothetical protein
VKIGDVGQQPQRRPGQVEQHRAAGEARRRSAASHSANAAGGLEPNEARECVMSPNVPREPRATRFQMGRRTTGSQERPN